jgi:regulator of replication initiation timing
MELLTENQNLKTNINKLRQELENQCGLHEKEKDKAFMEIKEREAAFQELEKVFDTMKKSNFEAKNELAKLKE